MTTEDRAKDTLTLKSLLSDTTTENFRRFAAFVHQTFCAENLAFLLSVKNYRERCQQLLPTLQMRSLRPMHSEPNLLSNHPFRHNATFLCQPIHGRPSMTAGEQANLLLLEQDCLAIVESHIRPYSLQEINIPCDMRQEILQYIKYRIYHPDIFSAASDAVMELMETNSFIPWMNAPRPPASSITPSLSFPDQLNNELNADDNDTRPSFTSFRSVHVQGLRNTLSSRSLKASVMRRVKRSLGIVTTNPKVSFHQYLSAPSTPTLLGENIRTWSPWRKLQR